MATKKNSVNSRQKGKRGERKAVAFLESIGVKARRTQQHCGAAGDSDVIAIQWPRAFIEVKYMAKLPAVESKMFQGWCKKIREQSPFGRGMLIAFQNGERRPRVYEVLLGSETPIFDFSKVLRVIIFLHDWSRAEN